MSESYQERLQQIRKQFRFNGKNKEIFDRLYEKLLADQTQLQVIDVVTSDSIYSAIQDPKIRQTHVIQLLELALQILNSEGEDSCLAYLKSEFAPQFRIKKVAVVLVFVLLVFGLIFSYPYFF